MRGRESHKFDLPQLKACCSLVKMVGRVSNNRRMLQHCEERSTEMSANRTRGENSVIAVSALNTCWDSV